MGGTHPAQVIKRFVHDGVVESEGEIDAGQIQPASLDLTLSAEGYAVPGSMLPLKGERVRDIVGRFRRRQLRLSEGEILVRGQVYWVRLRERLRLPKKVAAYANNKSSIGRIDLQTRLLTDGNPRYDKVKEGYQGELWLEISPKSFDVVLRQGDALNQCIFYETRTLLSGRAIADVHRETPLLFDRDGGPIVDAVGPDGLMMTLDLEQDIVGYVARRSLDPLDLRRFDHPPASFFNPIVRPKDGALFLSKDAFYILNTFERVAIPPAFAVEMLPYDTSAGEFRAHYAGFFDPGFGYGHAGEQLGTTAVLEVRPYEDDLIVRHRQPVCKLAFERLTEVSAMRYGTDVRSHYASQRGPRLSKFFARPA